MKAILYVAVGSAIGGVCRYLLHHFVHTKVNSNFPLGTLIVNLIGCFLIGIILGIADKTNIISPMLRLFLAVGICGGFTTYSSFMYENYTLMQTSQFLNVLLYLFISLFVGYAATWFGVACVKNI